MSVPMRYFLLLFSLCCPSTAFSAAFSPKGLARVDAIDSIHNDGISQNSRIEATARRSRSSFSASPSFYNTQTIISSNTSRFYSSTILVPRGGEQEIDTDSLDSEEIIDLDDNGSSSSSSNYEQNERGEEHAEIATEATPNSASASSTVASATAVTSPSSIPILKILSSFGFMIQSAGNSYSSALTAYPIITKSITAGITFFLSDYAAQRIERPRKGPPSETPKKQKSNTVKSLSNSKTISTTKTSSAIYSWKHDWIRTLTSCLVGLLYFGPAAHYWYEWIFAILPGTSLVSTLQKAILGQILFGPSFTCIFFAASLMQAGEFTVKSWVQKIQRDLPGAWISGSAFWPLVDLISYSVVPVKYIPLFINLCSFVWTVYLSMVANRKSSTSKV